MNKIKHMGIATKGSRTIKLWESAI